MLEQVTIAPLGHVCDFESVNITYSDLAPISFERAGLTAVSSQRNALVDVVASKVNHLKVLDRRELPKAIIELFSECATFEFLGDQFNGDLLICGSLDREFIEDVMSKCFTRLGTGSHSVAFELDDNWIIKMNCCNFKYTGEDAGFEWARACIEISGNIFVPKIAALYQKDFEYCMVVERLAENRGKQGPGVGWDDVVYKSPDAGCFLDLAEAHYDGMNFADYMIDMTDYETFILMAALNREDLIQLCKIYQKVAVTCSCQDDLEDFNMMIRGRIPVINDPFRDSKSGMLTIGNTFDWVLADG